MDCFNYCINSNIGDNEMSDLIIYACWIGAFIAGIVLGLLLGDILRGEK